MMFEMVGTCVTMAYVMYVVLTLAYSLPWLEGERERERQHVSCKYHVKTS